MACWYCLHLRRRKSQPLLGQFREGFGASEITSEEGKTSLLRPVWPGRSIFQQIVNVNPGWVLIGITGGCIVAFIVYVSLVQWCCPYGEDQRRKGRYTRLAPDPKFV
jgi:hypothetical protein